MNEVQNIKSKQISVANCKIYLKNYVVQQKEEVGH